MNSPSHQLRDLSRPDSDISQAVNLGLRIRWRLRSIPPRRLMAAVVGIIIGVATWFVVESAQDAKAHWGDRVPVLVASTDIPPGTELDSTNTQLVPYPIALTPRGALTSRGDGRLANHPVSSGQVIVSGQAGPDRHGLTALTRAVTLPQPLAAPALQVGDTVELIAVGADFGRTVASTIGSASVSAVNGEDITVVVDRLLVPAIFEALGSGSVELVRRPAQR